MNSLDKRNDTIFFILGIISIFIFWLILSVTINNEFAVPKIDKTTNALAHLLSDGRTYNILGRTILKIVIAISISFIVSLALVILSTLSRKFKAFIAPIITLLKTVPVVVVILLFLFLFSRNSTPIYVSLLVIMPIMYEALLNGINNIDDSIINETKMLSKTNLFILRKVYIPLTKPYIMLSILQSVGLGLKAMVMAELIAQTKNSIGYEMGEYRSFLDMEYIFAWGILMISIVIIVEIFIRKLKKKIAL
ncbi:MAG: ABC transporter permease subunit [Acholeplasmatales bacterium]|nr:ABC transporter permease subunit [Acholeplasmatales bacterium]